VVKARYVAGFWLSETAYRAGDTIPRHSHDLAFFYTVLGGAYTETLGRVQIDRAPLALAFRPAGEEHSHACGAAPARCFNLAVEPGWVERIREYAGRLGGPTEIRGPGVPALVAGLYREFTSGDGLALLAAEGLAVELLVAAARGLAGAAEAVHPRWLARVRDCLHARFAEPLSLAGVAATTGVHPVHLARVFRRRYGCTLGEYVRRLRVDFAAGELAQSDAPLAEIEQAAGFSDQSHFSKTFKRLTGATPTAYRAGRRG
jgi:AraC family transcriptional regulator